METYVSVRFLTSIGAIARMVKSGYLRCKARLTLFNGKLILVHL